MRALRSRTAPLLLILLVIAAACTGSDDDASTTTSVPPSTSPATTVETTTYVPPSPTTTATTAPPSTTTTTTTTLPPAALPTFDDDDVVVESDADVRVGVLDNGLTYYIRRNTAPGGRAQLRLAIKAGSVQEIDEQRGAAHYLEHMMFNGTERFPSNELVKVLSRFGAEFGPDINAYTSYEETVYLIELATEDITTVESGFDVLFEWATAVALDPVEVDLERGVLLEEWRLRDQGFWGRYQRGVTDHLLDGTAFENREPLANPEQLETITSEGLRAFFDAWYRPDTMAVVAVGDFDVDLIEDMIVERFGDVAKPVDAEPVPRPSTGVFSEPEYFIIADPEFPEAWSELNYPIPADRPTDTIGSVRRFFALSMAFDMLATRLREDTLRGTTPFFNSGRASNDLLRAHSTPGLLAWAKPQDLGIATEALLREVKRARTFGFSQEELHRAVEERRSVVELEFEARATKQDRDYAADYVENFLGGTPIPDADTELDLLIRILDEMTVDQVWQTFGATIDSTEPFVIIVAPENASGVIPDKAELAAIVDRVVRAPVEPWSDDSVDVDVLMERPDSAEVASRSFFSDTSIPEITLANGARIVMIQTEISDDIVVLRSQSPGGWALVSAGDVAEAQYAGAITKLSGIGGIDQVSLDRALSDQVAFVVPFITEVTEGIFGEASTSDLETLFQLLNLYMTQPRFEEGARDLIVSEQLQIARNAHLSPDSAVSRAVTEARYSGDARFAPLPSVEDFETFDLARAEEIYRERFGNPGDFVFVFAGDFQLDELEDLARRYIGSIPAGGAPEGFVDTRPDPPAGLLGTVVEAGTGDLGRVTLLFTTEVELEPELRVDLALLELVLQQRLTEKIREELSASYSPFAFVRLVEEPVDSVEFTVSVSADPADLDAVAEAVLVEIQDLRDNGPTDDELAIAQQQLLRDYELFSNEGLAAAILFYAEHPDEFLTEILTRSDRVIAATRNDLRSAARLVLPAGVYIDVRLIPIDFEPAAN